MVVMIEMIEIFLAEKTLSQSHEHTKRIDKVEVARPARLNLSKHACMYANICKADVRRRLELRTAKRSGKGAGEYCTRYPDNACDEQWENTESYMRRY